MKADTIVKIFKAAAQQPAPASAWILKSGAAPGKSITLLSKWSQRNLERGKMVKFQQTHIIDPSTSKATDMLPVDVSTESLSRISNSDEHRAILREVPSNGSNGANKQYLEIWKHHQLYQNYDLGALDVHGDVYTDDDFSALEWSPCETKILYVAECKVPKSEPFYKPKPQDSKESKENELEKAPQKGEEYTYRAEWGELLVGKHQSVVVICDLKTGLLTRLDKIPSSYSPAQVLWTPDGNGIVGVAFKNEPRRLGLVYCTNRESIIFHLSLDKGEFSILSTAGEAVRSPRFSPNGEYLIWLQRKAGGPHHAGQQLMCCSWKTKKVLPIIGLVNSQTSIANGRPFYGIYASRLPKRCWSMDSQRVLFSTPQLCRVASYVVDIRNGDVTELVWPFEGATEGSGTILDVLQNTVVMSRGSLREPAGLVLADLPPSGQEHTVKWMQVTTWMPPTDLQKCHVQYMPLVAKNTSDSVRDFNAIYIGPQGKPNGSVPLIVFPHGGPHSCFTDEYSLGVRLMVTIGYGVLMVNYRGSIGSGDDSVNFLPKRVGDADVKDVHQAAQAALEQFPCLNPKKCVLFGGSHGGFLVTHLSGQYPDNYCAVVARNPVVDIACMSGISDIPDWCYTEAGLVYNPASVVTKDELDAMRRCSPIQYASNVKAPTLLMLGKKDLRVPYSQGLLYYHTLHANGVTTKVHVYEDVHGLGNVPVEMDSIINSLLWFEEHIG
ncbi:acylamino-acid-releasing enzyme-like isoform X2 [Thrips palmi]|uniref:Acylamino-acid-releasing enzyme n=1 Tax=Thrips palmi TaxID=161013 RepID=A0A6P8ZGM8_THRPL|nr:acylamino-acid-releasing enzyme-like isoform X2 [Thrips palmi]